jgi:hypothetical protein
MKMFLSIKPVGFPTSRDEDKEEQAAEPLYGHDFFLWLLVYWILD